MWMVGTDRTVTGHVVSDVYSISDRTVHNGHVVSAVCSVCGWWDLI